MKHLLVSVVAGFAVAMCLLQTGCGGGGSSTQPPPPPVTTYTLTVNSATPASGVLIAVAPADNSAAGNGTTSFTRTYNAGMAITLTAPSTSGSSTFASWAGCTTVSTVTCKVTLNAATTVTATYSGPTITSITVTPNAAIIGSQVQFAASVAGTGSFSNAVTWSLDGPSGSSLSPGTLSSAGLYTTPYPAPASVTITATSVQDTTKTGSVTVTLSLPAASSGPALTVDAGSTTHPISPDIYGMNFYTLNSSVAKAANITVDRWGGDATSRYNYLLDVTSSASDWYFENQIGATGVEDTGAFNAQVKSDESIGAKTLGTVPVSGWVAKDGTACSYPTTTYPNQQKVAPDRACGNGVYPQGVSGCTNSNGCNITGIDPTLTSTGADASFVGNWVAYLVSKFGTAAKGGVAIYDLDNEPSWWDAVQIGRASCRERV